jgi:hypothetical protein
MKNVRLETLLKEDLEPYIDSSTVIRLKAPGTLLFIGRLDTDWADRNKVLRISNDFCEVIINPLIRLTERLIVPMDPQDPGSALCKLDWTLGKYEVSAELRPFRLPGPRRIIWDFPANDLLGIQSVGGHTAILSLRPNDLAEIEKMLDHIQTHI